MKTNFKIWPFLLFLLLSLKITSQAADIQAELSTETLNMLNRSCFDCHQGKKADSSWSFKLRRQVGKGTDKLNFADWANFSSTKKSRVLEDSIDAINNNEMPTEEYLDKFTHAKVDAFELEALKKDAQKFLPKINSNQKTPVANTKTAKKDKAKKNKGDDYDDQDDQDEEDEEDNDD